MTDTLRTDTLLIAWDMNPDPKLLIEHSRQLEKELKAANEIAEKYEDRYYSTLDRIKLLESANSDVQRIANERNAANQRIKQLEDIINRASIRFFADGSDGRNAVDMLAILEEARK